MPDAFAPIFSPSSSEINPILDTLLSDHASLPDIAARYNTSVEALALWMISPDIRERLERTDSVTCWRTRMLAAAQLPLVVRSLSRILDNYKRNTPGMSEHSGLTPGMSESSSESRGFSTDSVAHPLSDALLAHRSAETARKAATLLIRLSRIAPTAPPGRETPSAAPAASAPLTHRAPAGLSASEHSTKSDPSTTTIPAAAPTPTPASDPIAQFFAALANIPPEQLESIAAELESPEPGPHELAAVAAAPHLAEPGPSPTFGRLHDPNSHSIPVIPPHDPHAMSRSTDKPRPQSTTDLSRRAGQRGADERPALTLLTAGP